MRISIKNLLTVVENVIKLQYPWHYPFPFHVWYVSSCNRNVSYLIKRNILHTVFCFTYKTRVNPTFLVTKTSNIMQKKHPLHKKYFILSFFFSFSFFLFLRHNFILSFLKNKNKRRRYIQGGAYIKMTYSLVEYETSFKTSLSPWSPLISLLMCNRT